MQRIQGSEQRFNALGDPLDRLLPNRRVEVVIEARRPLRQRVASV